MQKVNKHGQVTIPKEIREAINLNEGDLVKVDIHRERNEVVFKVYDFKEREFA